MPPQPPQQLSSQDLAKDIADIRAYKREIDANLAKSEEILALSQSKLGAAQLLLRRAADEREKLQSDRAEVLKIVKGLKIREERLKQREEAISISVPSAEPYPTISSQKPPLTI